MNPPNMAETLELCGIDGDADEPVTTNKVNMFIRRAVIHHVQPLKRDVKETRDIQEAMKDDYAAIRNQLKGAKWALVVIAAILAFLIPQMSALIKAIELISK